jgi:hypothetical protein
MSFDIEISIGGLFAIGATASRPVTGRIADVQEVWLRAPIDQMHRPLLGFFAENFLGSNRHPPIPLQPDPTAFVPADAGRMLVLVDLASVEVEVTSNAQPGRMHLGDVSASVPDALTPASSVHWIPSIADLGIQRWNGGGLAKVKLPAGDVEAADILVDEQGRQVLWTMSGGGEKVIANRTLIRQSGATQLTLLLNGAWGDWTVELSATAGTVPLLLTCDVHHFARDYRSPVSSLTHFHHLDTIADLVGSHVHQPTKAGHAGAYRTARPACPQALQVTLL